MILSATPQTTPIQSLPPSSHFEDIAQELAQDQHQMRMKKLLVYACHHTWENDLQKLNGFSFEQLLKQLLTIAPTLEQLQIALQGIAGTLNKAAEYTLVANAIISRVSALYTAPPLEPQPFHTSKSYKTIAQLLAQDEDHWRIKKLLVLACKQTWETQVDKLDQFEWAELLHDLHHLTPTPESLEAVLHNLVKTLSKRAEYTIVAHKICSALQLLYTAHPPAIVEQADATEALSLLIHRNSAHQAPQRAALAAAEAVDRGSATSPPHQAATANREYGYRLQPDALADLFNMRLEIMQFVVPLRIKILLFSLLHDRFEFTAEHESMLKQYELDDLLRATLQTYKLFSELESRLHSTAKTLDEPDFYEQVTSMILRIVKPLYAYLPLNPSLSSRPDDPAANHATNIVSMSAPSYEATCPAPLES